MTTDDFVEQVRLLRESYRRKVASSYVKVAPLIDAAFETVDGVSYQTFWFKRARPDDGLWVVRLADIPGTLSGDILRFERGFPITQSSFEVIGDEVRPLAHTPPVPEFPDDEGEEDLSAALAPLPLISVDPEVHFVKTPKYASEIAHNLACLGGACPGAPKSPRIVPLLGKSAAGELVFVKLNTEWVLHMPAHTLSTYKTWILDLIDALRCLHALGIVHRDIRIANFVWSLDMKHLLVCDIEGRWGNFDAPEVAAIYQRLESRDSAEAMLEALSKGWTTRSDVYDVGTAIVSMVYAGQRHNAVVERPVPPPLDKIVAACTRPSPEERPSLDELYEMLVQIGPLFWRGPSASSNNPVQRRGNGPFDYSIPRRTSINHVDDGQSHVIDVRHRRPFRGEGVEEVLGRLPGLQPPSEGRNFRRVAASPVALEVADEEVLVIERPDEVQDVDVAVHDAARVQAPEGGEQVEDPGFVRRQRVRGRERHPVRGEFFEHEPAVRGPAEQRHDVRRRGDAGARAPETREVVRDLARVLGRLDEVDRRVDGDDGKRGQHRAQVFLPLLVVREHRRRRRVRELADVVADDFEAGVHHGIAALEAQDIAGECTGNVGQARCPCLLTFSVEFVPESVVNYAVDSFSSSADKRANCSTSRHLALIHIAEALHLIDKVRIVAGHSHWDGEYLLDVLAPWSYGYAVVAVGWRRIGACHLTEDEIRF
ncbi:hypothetical protein AURDEDRAFT_153847 [Auricularia subglabra TFB-10046 SS5]|nr:hypothetical protein AURDEDRAFT_153847 [Auricularia subglabra TFB-10046 SS5]